MAGGVLLVGQGRLPPKAPVLSSPTVGSTTSLVLTGVPPQNDGAGTVSFIAERSDDGASGWTRVDQKANLTLTDTTCIQGSKYFYRAAAVDGLGQIGTYSNVVQGQTSPSIPAITGAALSSTQIQVNLVTPSTDVLSPVTQYRVLQNTTGPLGTFTLVALVDQAALPYVITSLTGGVTYYQALQAVDAAGRTSPISNVVSITTPASANVTPFPRIWAHGSGGTPRAFDADSFIQFAQRLNGITISPWDGWEAGKTKTVKQICDLIHSGSQHANGTTVLRYHDAYIISNSTSNRSVIENAGWLVRDQFPAGPLTLHAGNSFPIGNMVSGGPVVGGRTYQQYAPDYICDYHYDGGAAGLAIFANAVNNSLDGTWFDDLQFQLQDGGDFNRDGIDDANSTASSALMRAGWSFVLNRFKTSKPTKLCTANVSQMQRHASASDIASLSGILDGGGMELMLGATASNESITGWQLMMSDYTKMVAFCKKPELVYFMHSCVTDDGRDFYRNDRPWQALRYGLASALMYDGAYCPCPNGINAGAAPTTSSGGYDINFFPFWADEYAVDVTTGNALAYPNVAAALGWMGQPIDAGPITVAWKQGLMRRRFRMPNGKEMWVILNPKGNPQQTFTTGQIMKAFTGTQSPSINNGATITATQNNVIEINEARFWYQP